MANKRIFQKQKEAVDKILKFRFLNKVIIFMGLVVALLTSLYYLDINGYITIPDVVKNLFDWITFIFVAFFIASLFARITVKSVVKIFEDTAEAEQKLLLSKLYSGIIYLFTIAIILWRLGVTLQNITLILGLLTTAFAFALRDVIISYFAWFILLTKKPFRIGDFIKIGEEEGFVKHIGTFYVLLDDTPEIREDYTRVPNKIFLEKPIKNYGRRNILFSFNIPIANIADDIYPKLDRLAQKIEKDLGPKAELRLFAEKEKWYVAVEFRSRFEDRSAIRLGIHKLFVKDLNDLLQNKKKE